METYSYISENGDVREIADLAAREKNDQQDIVIGGFDARITQAQEKADSVEAIAQNAQTTASAAQTTAQTAQTTAQNAQTTAQTAQSTATSAQTTATNALQRVNVVAGESYASFQVGTTPSNNPVYKQSWTFTDNNKYTLGLGSNRILIDYKCVESRLASGVTTWLYNPQATLTFTNSTQAFQGGDTTAGAKTYYLTLSWATGTY